MTDVPLDVPIVTPKAEPETVQQPVPVPARKPFKPKHAWLTESANELLEKRIVEEETKPLQIEPLTRHKLSRTIISRFYGEDLARRKTVNDESLNDFDERYCIKQRIKRDWQKISPIVPSAPEDYWNFSILTGSYHLDTSMQDRLSFPKNAPPNNLHPKLQDLFRAQEETRWKVMTLHV